MLYVMVYPNKVLMDINPLEVFAAIQTRELSRVKKLDEIAHLDALTSHELVSAFELCLRIGAYDIMGWFVSEFICIQNYLSDSSSRDEPKPVTWCGLE